MHARSNTPDISRAPLEAAIGGVNQSGWYDQLRPLLVSISEAQRLLGGIGKTAFYSAKDRYGIHLVRLGGRSMVPVSEIERVIDELMASPVEQPAKIAAATKSSLESRRLKRGAPRP